MGWYFDYNVGGDYLVVGEGKGFVYVMLEFCKIGGVDLYGFFDERI